MFLWLNAAGRFVNKWLLKQHSAEALPQKLATLSANKLDYWSTIYTVAGAWEN